LHKNLLSRCEKSTNSRLIAVIPFVLCSKSKNG
jgi:hypothetical protein